MRSSGFSIGPNRRLKTRVWVSFAPFYARSFVAAPAYDEDWALSCAQAAVMQDVKPQPDGCTNA
jgi:hypothetical protein